MSKRSLRLLVLFCVYGINSGLIAGQQIGEQTWLWRSLSKLGYEFDAVPNCRFQSRNTCQSKGSGGHSDTIFSLEGHFCAKRVRNPKTIKEVEFYLRIKPYCSRGPARPGLCDFFPEYAGLCKYKGDVYLSLENLKDLRYMNPATPHIQREDVWALDLKIGERTAISHAHNLSGLRGFFHRLSPNIDYLLDRHLTSSVNLGFRFAGFSGREKKVTTKKNILRKLALLRKPRKIIQDFMDGEKYPLMVQCFSNKLKQLYYALNKSDANRFHLVGSSLLFVYGHSVNDQHVEACGLHMIDFVNSHIIDQGKGRDIQNNLIYIDGYRHGVESLMHEFSDYFVNLNDQS